MIQGSYKYKETLGGVVVRGLWDRQVDAIIGVKIGDADADTYKYETMAALLSRWKNIKKYKHGKHFHDQQKQFSSFFLSVDRILWREALVRIYQFSQVIAEKRE